MNDWKIPGMTEALACLKDCARLALLAIALAGCANPQTHPQTGSRDHLLGWFKLSKNNTLIPVFKRAGTYYSICRGAEIPLKECPEGLEWAVSPSSMTGTKIGWDAASQTPYLAVVDAQASNFTDGRYGVGEKEPMTRINKPPDLLDAKAPRPRTRNDLLGWYQPVWLPWVKIGIRIDGDRFVSQDQVFHGPEPGSWKTSAETRDLTPLPDQLGFTGFERHGGPRLVYNGALKRFELVMTDPKRRPSEIRMPLARLPASSSPERDGSPPPAARIGIPSWH
jgi:hypothetical protein